MVFAVVIVGGWTEEEGDGAVELPPPQAHTRTSNDAMNARVMQGLPLNAAVPVVLAWMYDDSVRENSFVAAADALAPDHAYEHAETCSRHRAFTLR